MFYVVKYCVFASNTGGNILMSDWQTRDGIMAESTKCCMIMNVNGTICRTKVETLMEVVGVKVAYQKSVISCMNVLMLEIVLY